MCTRLRLPSVVILQYTFGNVKRDFRPFVARESVTKEQNKMARYQYNTYKYSKWQYTLQSKLLITVNNIK